MQCETNDDCAGYFDRWRGVVFCDDGLCAQGPRSTADWQCAGAPPVNNAREYAFGLTLIDLFTERPLPDASARLCSRTGECGAAQAPGADGTVFTNIPPNFYGWVEFTHPNYLDSRLVVEPSLDQLLEDPPFSHEMGLPSPSVIDLIDVFIRDPTFTVDTSAAAVFVQVSDCSGARAAGVSVALEPLRRDTRVVYLVGQTPSTDAVATTDSGLAVVLNAPPGEMTLTARAEGRVIGRSWVNAGAGAVTTARWWPRAGAP